MASSAGAVLGSESLSASIKRLLLDRIVTGDLVPGERIVESRLAKELAISQSPVREALRDLAAMGMVDIESRRGASVRKPDAQELRDVSEVRAEIDALAARLAAERLDVEGLAALQDAYDRMLSCWEAEDHVGMTEADAEFHGRIAEASGNGAVVRVFGMLEPFARTFITLTSPHVEVEPILRQHGDILEALVARDPALAASRAHQHQMAVRSAFFVEPSVDASLLADDGR